ncbi:MAG: peptidylprolyl isomerase [Longimonas sp.]|uniref:peptidylprolyl isomerase n=1 Tax=Longimonas sp. TaxID=2039626 RepID=UPI0033626FE9
MTTLRSLRRPSGILGGFLALLLVLVGCGENGASNGENGDAYPIESDISDPEVAAIVSSDYGTDTLRTDEFQQQMQFAMQSMPPQQSGDQMNELHRMMLDQYVGDHVLRGEAQARGVEADADLVDQQMEQQRSQFPSEEEFQDALDTAGITIDSLRSMIAEQAQVQQLRDELAAEAAAVEPSDEEIAEYAAEQRNLRARHILIRADEGAPEEEVADARQRAQDLIDQLNDGADFEELAREYSDGPTGERGGDLGYFTRDRMVEPFADAVFALEEDGELVQEPVRTQFGFHVIQLVDYGEPMDTDQARQALMQDQEQEAFDTALDDLKGQAQLRVNPEVIPLSDPDDQE